MSTKCPSPASARSLADVILRVTENGTLGRQRRQDLCSAVRVIARVLGAPPEAIEANVEVLRLRIAPIPHSMAGLSKPRWANVRSAFGAALTVAGVGIIRRRRKELLAPAWRALIERVPDRYERSRLSRFFSWCSAGGIDPRAVDAPVVERFAISLRENTLVERPKQLHRDLVLAWNRSVSLVPGWPAVEFPVPNNRRDYARPLAAYPASFGADVDAYLSRLSGADLFAEGAIKPMAPATLRDVRMRIGQLAAALVLSGRDPACLHSLGDLVAVDAAKDALTYLFQRNGRRRTGQLLNFGELLIKVAKHHVRAPEAQLDTLRAMRRKVDPGVTGMTERNRRRLRQFDDPENLRRLLEFPGRVFRELPSDGEPGYELCIRAQSALVVAILQVAPLRIENVAGLRLDRHLTHHRPGGPRHLVIPADETKNDKDLEFQLPFDVARLIDTYLERVRPVLLTGPSPHLFPRRSGGSKTPGQLAAQVKRAIACHCGVDLNAHAFRHLAGKLFLERHPGEYATVQMLLGHKSLQTTIRAYCGLERADAIRRYDTLIDTLRREHTRAA
jgi:integrase